MASNCNSTLVDTLQANVGRIVTVFTDTSSTCGFTGLCAAVDSTSVKLITQTTRAPLNPLASTTSNSGCQRNVQSDLGTAVLIPVSKITSLVYNEI